MAHYRNIVSLLKQIKMQTVATNVKYDDLGVIYITKNYGTSCRYKLKCTLGSTNGVNVYLQTHLTKGELHQGNLSIVRTTYINTNTNKEGYCFWVVKADYTNNILLLC